MRVSRQKTSLVLSLFLLTFFSITVTARADDDESDDYDVKARVARISLMAGEVNLQRSGNKDFEPARLNYPLVEGDIVATGRGSLLEIQVDARNFVRLAANSSLRIVTLRNEGIALSVMEGTVVVRLNKFDRDNEYFELDAPKTTLAAEKKGLYRIDVPSQGRVRLTVRDGGTARIYSDTSGFTLRDGRSAELIAAGENAGDWEFSAAASTDAVDDWVKEREQYYAQHLNPDVQYFDEYVWGAEDLAAYGDWIRTDDYGWIWRPHPSAIGVYNDWAPYRYGQWTWCSPYGWTWVGYEPWGWAPYHYGRWVYYNNYWAWSPRSKFYKKRSWWRPALVAFVFDISFGDNVCWYPLSYYQRDPHSRYYRHHDRDQRPGYGSRPNDRHDYDDRKTWRGVTRVPRHDFGNPDRRGQAVEEPVARRVVDAEPEFGDLPRRSDDSDRSGRRLPVMRLPDTPTGATDRTPGVALDDDLRRSRIFRGREPRSAEPPQTSNTATPRPATQSTDTQPTGAVTRPEPGSRGNRREEPRNEAPEERPAGRMARPTMPDGAEKRGRNQQAIENTPRNDAPAPRTEPRSEPRERSEPRSEAPRPEPRHESPRSESPRSESPRSESPRSEPAPRSEPPARSESPRSESPREAPSKPDKPDRPMF